MKKKKLISLALAFTLMVTLIIPAWLPVYAVDISGRNITGDSGGGSNAQMTYDAGFTTDIENTQETTITGTSDTDKMAADSVTEAVYPDDANTQATALRAFELSMEADITVDTWAELAAAVSAAPTGTETIIEIGSGFNAGSVINIPSDTDIVIQSSVGETYTITRNNGFTDTFFKVKGGGKLALENIILDGNGSSVTATAPVMYISSTGEFTMDGATIQNVKGNVDFGQPAGVFVQTNGTMTMKNGSVIENVVNITAFGAFYVAGTLNMEDSSVINCTGTNCGGVAILNGIFNMSGSSVITGNKGDFGGVELSTAVIFNLSGSPDISRNTKTNGTTPCNVFFGSSGMIINIAGTLSNTTPVGVTSYVAVTKSNPKDITAESDQNWSSYFTSDNPSYKIRNSGKDSSQVVRLVISGIYTWDDLAAAVSAAPAGTETVLDIMTDLDADSEIDIPTGADIVIQSGSGGPYTITRDASFVDTVFKVAGGGKLTLKNAAMDGNDANVNSTFPMVYVVDSGDFTLDTGASIQNINGSVPAQSAGVYTEPGSAVTIKNGAAINHVVNSYSFGAMYVGGTLNMEGGSITGCEGTACGGVYVDAAGTVNMSGGSVTGNTGGGIAVAGEINLSGAPDISGNHLGDGTDCNLYLQSYDAQQINNVVNVAGELTNTTPIGITTIISPSEGSPVSITAASDHDWSSYFTSDVPSYIVQNSGSGSSQVVQLAASLTVDVNTWAQLCAVVNAAPTDGTETAINVTADLTANSTCNVGGDKNIVIQSSGGPFSITRDSSYKMAVFFIDSSGSSDPKLLLKNITLDGNGGNVTATFAMVYLSGGEFTMDSGTTIQNIKGNVSYGSPGVEVQAGGIMTMNNGAAITDVENTDPDGYGALLVKATLNMDGGSITGCKAAVCGGIETGGTFNLSGAPDISGNTKSDGTTPCNVFLESGSVVNVAGALTNTTPIGITTEDIPTASTPIDITAASDQDWSGYFTSDDTSYIVQNSGSGSSQVVQLAVCNTINVSNSSGTNLPTGVTYAGNLFTIGTGANNKTINVVGTTNANTIEVATGVTNLTLILNGVSIDLTATYNTAAPIDIQSGADVTIQLVDGTTSTLISDSTSSQEAGLSVPSGATATINGGTGILNATNGGFGAGIGGGMNVAGGTIIINGGTINATGNFNGAGIGGGSGGAGGNITINGGTINATAGGMCEGAGIGGGVNGAGGTITINGGIIVATGSISGGAGIGGGANGASGNITIGVSAVVTAVSSGDKPAIDAASGSSGSVINAKLNSAIDDYSNRYIQCNGKKLTLPGSYLNFAFSETAASTVKAYSNPSCTTLLGSIVQVSDGTPNIAVDLPTVTTNVKLYVPTVTVNKDASTWTSGAPNIKLSTSNSSPTVAVTGTLSSGVYTFTATDATQTYYVWDTTNSKYTGQSVTSGSPNATVNYYTVTLSSTAGITSTSGSGTYLSGSDVPISAAVTGGYNWSKWVLNSNGNLVSTTNAYTITSISSAQSYKAVATASNAPAIQTTSLPDGTAGTAYSQNLSAMSLTPFTLGWSIVSGSLPTGLDLIPSTGTISGTPSASGTFNFTVQATDSNGSSTKALSITILPVLSGTVNLTIDPSNGQVTALATGGNTDSEGTLTYTWSGGATGTGTTATPTPGTVTACTVTASGASGSVSASITVYKVTVTKSGNTGTDDAFIANAYGKAGDSIGIAYTLDSTGTQSNTLTYGGATTSPGAVSTPGSGISTYIISTGDASSGTIPLTATFSHISIQTYVLTINGGGTGVSGAGTYASGDLVSINAGTKNGYTFSGWTTSNGGSFADESRTSTTFTMPANNTTITATFTYNGGGGGSHDSTPTSAPTPTTTPTPAPTPTPANVPIIIDNNNYDIGKVAVEGNTATITVNQSEFEKQLAAAKYSVVVPVTSDAKTVVAQLVVKNVQDMNVKGVPLSVQTGKINYSIPASSIDTKEILSALGAPDPSLAPVNVIIRTDVDPATQILVNSAVKAAKSKEVVPALQFEITASYNGKTYKVENFDRFVSRSVEITSDQAQQTTTAIVIDTDGTIRHVPTFVYQKNGKWYAQINSLTNSTYALIFNQMSFSDAEGKWYQSVVKEMGSRKIINGVGSNDFAGDKAITRAEFAAIVVRALGLPATGTAAFKDVPSGSWYSGAVATAAHYGIVNGIGGNKFSPDAKITREQAMQMICNASKLTPYMAVTGSDNTKSFTDYGTQSVWATNAVNFNINNEFIQGFKGQFNPKSDITRAETAAVVLRLLQKSGLVDVRTKL